MAYKLKPKEPGFQVTREGEFEYHKFLPGRVYEKVPPEEAHRFEEAYPKAVSKREVKENDPK